MADAAKPTKGQFDTNWLDGVYMSSPIGAFAMQFALHRDDDDGPQVFIVKFPPDYEVPPHSHSCDYLSVVLEGSLVSTRKHYPVGAVRFVRADTGYGPLKYGPEGCTLLEVFARTSGVKATPLRASDQARFDEISQELAFRRQVPD